MTWTVFVMSTGEKGGIGPANRFDTKREALTFIETGGKIDSITRTVVPGGRQYVVRFKKRD